MTLPEFERVLFRKAPLKLVVAQIRFPVMPRFCESGFIAAFEEALRSEYPRRSREQQLTYKMSPQGLEPAAGATLWRLATRDNHWAVVVGETAVTLEVRGYTAVDELVDRFARILSAASETLDVTERA